MRSWFLLDYTAEVVLVWPVHLIQKGQDAQNLDRSICAISAQYLQWCFLGKTAGLGIKYPSWHTLHIGFLGKQPLIQSLSVCPFFNTSSWMAQYRKLAVNPSDRKTHCTTKHNEVIKRFLITLAALVMEFIDWGVMQSTFQDQLTQICD